MFDAEGAAYDAIMEGRVKPGQVMVIRYEGPKGRYAVDHMHETCDCHMTCHMFPVVLGCLRC